MTDGLFVARMARLLGAMGMACGLAGIMASPASAHPHVWVDVASEVAFDEEGRIIALRHHWRFDAAFSAYATQGLDTDGDGRMTAGELKPLAEVNVSSLAEFDYFTDLTAGGEPVELGQPEDYWLQPDGDRLILHFTLPLKEPLAAQAPVVLDVYDPEYFVAFSLPSEEAVRLVEAPEACQLTVTLGEEPDASAAAMLATIGVDQRELPAELKALTIGTENSARIECR
ncbi:DUF1007 family protein [Afifella pfennigii]|uniref:DUF1007 family protein n=1 Tax=Afifella pfennigii TaxID=209897 RepID=UPI00068D5E38|nr:DUF1007 family protein [Afifella pfennigii]